MKTKEYIFSFHKGRDKRNNRRKIHCYGNCDFQKLQSVFSNDIMLENTNDNNELLPDSEWKIIDTGGNTILIGRDKIEAKTGALDFDGKYDTAYSIYIENCNEEELQAVYDNKLFNTFPSEVRGYVEQEILDDGGYIQVIDRMDVKEHEIDVYTPSQHIHFDYDDFFGQEADVLEEQLYNGECEPNGYDSTFDCHYGMTTECARKIIKAMQSEDWID